MAIIVDFPINSMVIFHSYVKLPEGTVTMAGWWLSCPFEKYEEFVKWDYEIPNIWKNNWHVPNHQPDGDFSWLSFHIIPYMTAL